MRGHRCDCLLLYMHLKHIWLNKQTISIFQCQWGEMYNQLLAYKELHGHAKPPSREYIPGYKYTVLGRWCSTMRHNHSNGKLSEERIKLLEEIGFEWAEIKTTPWEERLQVSLKSIVDSAVIFSSLNSFSRRNL